MTPASSRSPSPRPDGTAGALHAVVRRARARDLLPHGTLDYFHTHVCAPGAAGCTSTFGGAKVTGTSTTPGKLDVGVLVPVAGTWRLFLQFRDDGKVADGAVHAAGAMRRAVLLAAAAAALALPAGALAHAALLRTVPAASVTVEHAAEALGRSSTPRRSSRASRSSPSPTRTATRQTAGRPPLRGEPRRARRAPATRCARAGTSSSGASISVDGHPVRGAFTFAVGPNPGPAPQFVIPSLSETAATPDS